MKSRAGDIAVANPSVGQAGHLAMAKFAVGQKFGAWELVEKLGEGGNGEVWKVTTDSSEQCAIKLLIRGGVDEPYKRFCREIDALQKLEEFPGIVPLLESHIPEDPNKERPWYRMPLATPYLDTISDKSVHQITADFELLASTLARLHSLGICHRDVKPANFLVLNGMVCLSDFGLVKLPKADGLTPERRDVGAKFTIAPEMRRAASSAAGDPADVYSLAKSLWIVLTGVDLGFEGQYDPQSSTVGLSRYLQDSHYLTPLNELLVAATDHAPEERPSAEDFSRRLAEWVRIDTSFEEKIRHQWREISERLFPLGQPSRAQWEDRTQICSVLKLASRVEALNHMFYPTGGGMTLRDADVAPEEGMIQLRIDENMFDLCAPARLIFEPYPGKPEWSYFRLELRQVQSVEDPDSPFEDTSEEVTEIQPGCYAPLTSWFEGEHNGQPLPDSARRVTRFSGGSIVLFSTTSPYNQDSNTYDARHNMVSTDEFRAYIHENAALTS